LLVYDETTGKSLKLGHEWRTARVDEIETSKQALEILAEVREKERQKMKEEQRRMFDEVKERIRNQVSKEQLAAAPLDVRQMPGSGAFTSEEEISVLSASDTLASQAQYTTLASCGLIATGDIMPEDENDPRGTFRGVAGAAGLRSGLDGYDDYSTSGTVNISMDAAKAKRVAAKSIVAEKMVLTSQGGRRVISVAYGHTLNVLGTIDVLASTTYTQVCSSMTTHRMYKL
jgi:hypothetical protein